MILSDVKWDWRNMRSFGVGGWCRNPGTGRQTLDMTFAVGACSGTAIGRRDGNADADALPQTTVRLHANAWTLPAATPSSPSEMRIEQQTTGPGRT